MKRIIGLHGGMGHGKDTLGKFLSSALQIQEGYSVYNRRFAYAVKKHVSQMTGIKMSIIDNESYNDPVWDFTREQKSKYLPDWNMTVGRLLQIYATEGVRDAVHPEAWIFTLANEIANHRNYDTGLPHCKKVYIITDLRFENELNWIQEQGGICIKIKRPEIDLKDGRSKNHASEAGLDDDLFDIIIDNDSDIAALVTKAEALAGKLDLFPQEHV